MRTFVQTPKQTHQNKSTKSTKLGRAFLRQNHDIYSILKLQQTIGNQAVQRLLKLNPEEPNTALETAAPNRFVHDFSRIPLYTKKLTKLTVSTPGDIYEQEADLVADRVMRMPELTPKLEDGLSKQSPPGLESRLGMTNSSGQSLPRSTKTFMESRFLRDFTRVRVHLDSEAARMNKELNAQAFTYGTDVYFGFGKYSPESTFGKWLLAHELTHVIQQSNTADMSDFSKLAAKDSDFESERKLDEDANQGAYGHIAPAISQKITGVIQRNSTWVDLYREEVEQYDDGRLRQELADVRATRRRVEIDSGVTSERWLELGEQESIILDVLASRGMPFQEVEPIGEYSLDVAGHAEELQIDLEASRLTIPITEDLILQITATVLAEGGPSQAPDIRWIYYNILQAEGIRGLRRSAAYCHRTRAESGYRRWMRALTRTEHPWHAAAVRTRVLIEEMLDRPDRNPYPPQWRNQGNRRDFNRNARMWRAARAYYWLQQYGEVQETYVWVVGESDPRTRQFVFNLSAILGYWGRRIPRRVPPVPRDMPPDGRPWEECRVRPVVTVSDRD